MSRSYRKPIVTDGYKGSRSKQWNKRYANRVICLAQDVPDGKAYKKFFESWNICDYKWDVDLTKEEEPWKYNRK